MDATPQSPTDSTVPQDTTVTNSNGSTSASKRPRLDLKKEKKRGMFGLVLGTLNRAKTEDKERNASEAAKKRQLIDQRLQTKLRRETDSVRRTEEAKKDKTSALRKEEELQLQDSIHKLRRTRLPQLSNFLLTSDPIPTDGTPLPPHGPAPALYYLPVILTPAQEEFLENQKAEVKVSAEKEWTEFVQERATGIEEISQLRQRVAEEEACKKAEQRAAEEAAGTAAMETEGPATEDTKMEVAEPVVPPAPEPQVKEEQSTGAPDEDAVEY